MDDNQNRSNQNNNQKTLLDKYAPYRIEYAKKKYKRIPLDVSKEMYEEIKRAADSQEESVNGYIKNAIKQRIESGQ